MVTTSPGEQPTASAEPGSGHALDQPLALHPLTYLDEGDEVTVGRSDIDSYAVFPADGAALLRQLAAGLPPDQAAEWYEATFGDPVDMVEFLAGLTELGFVRTGDAAPAATPVRWTRLGRAVFSPAAFVCYGLALAWCVYAMVHWPDLRPGYRNIFFTRYLTVVEITLFIGQFPLPLGHEAFHALAGRRLGLRSRLSIGHRLYFIVFETSMDGLVAVPRRRRYLPMLAGMLADVLAFCALTTTAALTRAPDGAPSLLGRVCLALAFTTVLRFVWQFYFYLQTDLYHVICVTIGCLDLQTVARRTLRNRMYRLLRREPLDESTWYPRDRAVARWYSWLLLAGYAVSIGTLVLAAAPAGYRFLRGVAARFTGGASGGELADSLVFCALNLFQLAVVGAISLRARRDRPLPPEHLLT